jgi:radical SAM protein with 4Fe4S-binding SPASM domain
MDCLIPQTRLEKLIIDSSSNGVIIFDLMGGEVLLYKKWKWLVKTLLKNGHTPCISTKIPVSKKTIDDMYDFGLRLFQISLDSFEPDIIEKNLNITNGVDYLIKMHQALKYAENKGIKVNIHSVITKYNKDISHLNRFINELSKFNNINNYQVTVASASLYKYDFHNHRISLEEANVLERHISEIKKEFPFRINFSGNSFKAAYINDVNIKASKFDNRSLCTGNVRSVYILPNGDVTICEELMFHPKFILGNVIQDDLQTIWKRNQLDYLEDINYYKDSPCGICSSFGKCKTENHPRGVCWKEILHAYGEENWHYPDPKCPNAPQEMKSFYLDN